jgi:hypothetical protein
MFSYYTKCYGLFTTAAGKEEMDAEDSKLIQEMKKKLNINDKDSECIRKEIEDLRAQLEDSQEEAEQRE